MAGSFTTWLVRSLLMQGQMRWIVAQKNRVRNGELYRFIADSKGAFVQVRTATWTLCVFCVYGGVLWAPPPA